MTDPSSSRSPRNLPFLSRLWFAWVCFFRVLFDGAYAGALSGLDVDRVKRLGDGGASPDDARAPSSPRAPSTAGAGVSPANPVEPALQLLALLQREGRLVDFLEEDVASFPDADIGAAARVVHAGCRRALREHVKLEPVRTEDEGTRVTLAAPFSASEVKLTGNVQGTGPYTGTLRHRGWRAKDVTLPTAVSGHDASVLAQAEVEL